MKATNKHEAIDAFFNALSGVNRVDSISKNLCVFCKEEAKDFTNALSVKEFTISGMCQACQDSVFSSKD